MTEARAIAGRGKGWGAASRWLPAFAGLAASVYLSTLPFLHVAANRLVVGSPVSAQVALGPLLWPIIGLAGFGALLLTRHSRPTSLAAVALFVAAFILLAIALGSAASELSVGQPPATRIRLASGAWIAGFLLATAIVWAANRTGRRGAAWLAAIGLIGILVVMFRLGQFDSLSLAIEYRARSETVQEALVRHLAISSAALVLAALLCVLLSLWRGGRWLVDLVVNGVQVVPGVALLGGLVALVLGLLKVLPSLREAGLSALGPVPAVIGIAAYLLLPFWRGLHAALRAPEPATLDAARALGLSPRQILAWVSLPLGAPILVGALRVASVQAIGLTTLGALVGAGGLGGIVFDGMAQFAPDLILLGAIPIIALSLGIERGLSLVEDILHRRWRA